jgi:hypothetical protein
VTVCMCLKHSHWATLNNIRLKREICKQIFWLSTPPPPGRRENCRFASLLNW